MTSLMRRGRAKAKLPATMSVTALYLDLEPFALYELRNHRALRDTVERSAFPLRAGKGKRRRKDVQALLYVSAPADEPKYLKDVRDAAGGEAAERTTWRGREWELVERPSRHLREWLTREPYIAVRDEGEVPPEVKALFGGAVPQPTATTPRLFASDISGLWLRRLHEGDRGPDTLKEWNAITGRFVVGAVALVLAAGILYMMGGSSP